MKIENCKVQEIINLIVGDLSIIKHDYSLKELDFILKDILNIENIKKEYFEFIKTSYLSFNISDSILDIKITFVYKNNKLLSPMAFMEYSNRGSKNFSPCLKESYNIYRVKKGYDKRLSIEKVIELENATLYIKDNLDKAQSSNLDKMSFKNVNKIKDMSTEDKVIKLKKHIASSIFDFNYSSNDSKELKSSLKEFIDKRIDELKI